jgi:hypothetical protein
MQSDRIGEVLDHLQAGEAADVDTGKNARADGVVNHLELGLPSASDQRGRGLNPDRPPPTSGEEREKLPRSASHVEHRRLDWPEP